jgi:aminoglycoside phosphotransferase (APT) family kinase protein
MEADAATRLLGRLRDAAGDVAATYADAPAALPGGFETRTYALRLTTERTAWAQPLVLRILPAAAGAAWLEREHAVLRWLRERAYPAPRVLATCADVGVVGGPFLVMERLAGTDMLRDLVPRRVREVTPTLAALQQRLHDLDPAGLADALPRIEDLVATLRARIAEARLDGLQAGLAWLETQRPVPRTLVVCHGDFHPRNVLMRDGQVQGVIDWSLAVMADPAYDVGSARVVLAYAPSDLPRALAPLLAAFQRTVVAPRFVRQYRKHRPLDPGALRYYEALRAFRSLVWAGESRRLAQGMTLPDARPGPWDAPPLARRLARHFERCAGVVPTLPD